MKVYVDVQSAVPAVPVLINQSDIYLFVYIAKKLLNSFGGQ
jgi:hypothetical protein